MNNLIIAKDYATFGDEGLTSNKVIYYKDDNMVKFKANVSDDPFALPETITVKTAKEDGLEAVKTGKRDTYTVPDGIKNLDYLFNFDTVLQKIYFPSSYSNLGMKMFYFSQLSSVNSNSSGIVNLWEGLTKVPIQCFQNCLIQKVYLPSTLTIIDMYGFASNKYLTDVDFSKCSSLTSISSNAFENCTALKNVDLSACTSLTTISTTAFSGCSEIEYAIFPTNIVKINSSMFRNCTSLKRFNSNVDGEAYFKEGITYIDNYSFQNTAITSITYLPSTLTTLGNHTFAQTNITNVNLANATSLKTMNYCVFQNCTKLTEVDLSHTVLTTISTSLFNGCTALQKVNIPDTVTSISTTSFANCSSLVEVNFGNTRTTVPTIQSNSFMVNTDTKFIVPDALYDTWITKSVWKTSTYLSHIIKYSEYYTD